MAKIVSFNKDCPALKAKFRSWDLQFHLRLTAEYLNFAGQESVRAFRVAASNGLTGYFTEVHDKGTLIEWLRHNLTMTADDAYRYADETQTRTAVELPYLISDAELVEMGVQQPCKSFTEREL